MTSLRPSKALLTVMVIGLLVAAVPIFEQTLWMAVVGIWSILTLAILIDMWTLFRARVTLAVTLPKQAGVGEAVAGTLHLESQSARPLLGELDFSLEGPLRYDNFNERQLVEHGASAFDFELIASARGRGTVRATWLKLAGPLGLVEGIWRQETHASVAITPFVERLRNYAIRHVPALERRGGLRLSRRRGEGTEFDSLRAYAMGMDTRHVDWKVSARHHALRVRHYRHERNQNVVICIDTGRLMGRPVAALTRLDHAIHATLLLAETALRGRDLVSMTAYGASPRAFIPPSSDFRQLGRLRQTVAELKPESAETNHALGLRALLSRLRRRSFVVVFTDFVDSTTAEIMTEYLTEIAKRHFVVFVSLDDPAIESAFKSSADDPQSLAEALVKTQLSDRRALVMNQLAHAGIRVVTGSPETGAADLLRRYLDAKRRGQIG